MSLITCSLKTPTLVHYLDLYLEDHVEPVQCQATRLPVAIKPEVKQIIMDYKDRGILIPVDEPTDWCSAMSVQQRRVATPPLYRPQTSPQSTQM